MDKRVKHTTEEKIRAAIVNGIVDWRCKSKDSGDYNNGAIYIVAALKRFGYKIVNRKAEG